MSTCLQVLSRRWLNIHDGQLQVSKPSVFSLTVYFLFGLVVDGTSATKLYSFIFYLFWFSVQSLPVLVLRLSSVYSIEIYAGNYHSYYLTNQSLDSSHATDLLHLDYHTIYLQTACLGW